MGPDRERFYFEVGIILGTVEISDEMPFYFSGRQAGKDIVDGLSEPVRFVHSVACHLRETKGIDPTTPSGKRTAIQETLKYLGKRYREEISLP